MVCPAGRCMIHRVSLNGGESLMAKSPLDINDTHHWPVRPRDIPKLRRHIHLIEVKYCEDTRPDPQLEASRLQHKVLWYRLKGLVSLHSILLGVGGTVYTSHTLNHFTQIGLHPQRATILANKAN